MSKEAAVLTSLDVFIPLLYSPCNSPSFIEFLCFSSSVATDLLVLSLSILMFNCLLFLLVLNFQLIFYHYIKLSTNKTSAEQTFKHSIQLAPSLPYLCSAHLEMYICAGTKMFLLLLLALTKIRDPKTVENM